MGQVGVTTAELPASAMIDTLVGTKDGNTVAVTGPQLAAQLGGQISQTMGDLGGFGSAPFFHTVTDPAANRIAIQEALDGHASVIIPAGYGEIVIDRPLLLNDGQRFHTTGNLKRADGMHDNQVRPKNSIAHLVGNKHPGDFHPFSPLNIYWPDASGARQVWEVDGRIIGQTFDIWLDTFWHTGSTPVGKVAIGDVVTTADGLSWQVVEEGRNSPVVNKNGVRFVPALLDDIECYSFGGRWDGNGANNREDDPSHFTHAQRYRRHVFAAAGVRRLRTHNLSYRNSAMFNSYFTDVRDAKVFNTEFDQASFAALGFRNGDGLHFDAGCHDIEVDGTSGETSDDVVAFVLTRPQVPRSYPHDDPDNLFPVSMTKINGRYPFYDDQSNHASKLKVARNAALPINTNYAIRAIASDGRRIETYDFEATSELSVDDTAGNAYGRRAAASVVRIGGKRFGIVPSGPSDIRGGTVRNLSGSARSGLEIGWSVEDLTVTGTVAEYSDLLASSGADDTDKLIRGQNAITIQPGNDIAEKLIFKAPPARHCPHPGFTGAGAI